MVSIEEFRKWALSMLGAEEQPHFENPSFRANKRIFATYHIKDNKAMLKLSLVDQSVFCAYDAAVFYPVPGTWGKQGATFVTLDKVRKGMFKDALGLAYMNASQKAKRNPNRIAG